VTTANIDRARGEGVTDTEIHEAVLIAAAFCMFNPYVDGLATLPPKDLDAHDLIGQRWRSRVTSNPPSHWYDRRRPSLGGWASGWRGPHRECCAAPM
jgi:hypothetical protein